MAQSEPGAQEGSGDADPQLIADACSHILLFASGHIADIVTDLPFKFAVVDIVQGEAQYIRRDGDGDDAHELVPVDWSELVASGRTVVLSLSDDAEAATYVELLNRLDDGEAATLAIAIHRSLAVATDDRVARREFVARAPRLPLFSTLELLHQWCELRGLAPEEVGALLKNVRERGVSFRRGATGWPRGGISTTQKPKPAGLTANRARHYPRLTSAFIRSAAPIGSVMMSTFGVSAASTRRARWLASWISSWWERAR